MGHDRAYRVQTLLQILIGAGVAAGAVFLGVKVYGYATARADYQTMAEAYTTAATPDTGAAGAAAPALDVDFAKLTAEVPGAAAWLQMDDLPISYPVMQPPDNDYYLTRAPDGSKKSGGSLFIDCANTGVDDAHLLIYGHHMQDGSMFGTLGKYKDEDFYKSGTGTFTLYTPGGARRYRIFSVQSIGDSGPVYTIGFGHDAEFQTFLDGVKAASLYDTGVPVSAARQVITLSTCATVSGEGRLVVSAVETEE